VAFDRFMIFHTDAIPVESPYPIMRILVVEDDKKIASSTTYDAAVLDLMLPKLDGLSFLRRIRQDKINIPVLILSAKASVDDRVKGLQSGGDDYLTKPFAFSELLARVQALIRRATHTTEPTRLQCADLSLDLVTREVRRGDQVLELQSKEFSLLELLLRHPGRAVTKTMILEHVWDFSFDPQTNVVDVLVHRLRTKVDKDFDTKLIHTLRGVGYVLKPA